MKNIFNIQLRHTYFTTGLFPSAELQFSAVTQELLRGSGLALRRRDSNYYVFAPSTDALFTNLADDATLEFEIKLSDPMIANATDLPLDKLVVLLFNSEQGSSDLVVSQQDVDPKSRAALFAKVVIRVGDFLTAFQGEPIDYTVQFEARSVAVHYIMVPNSDIGQLHLTGPVAQQFTGPETVQLPNGPAGQQFSSGSNTFLLHDQMSIELGVSGTLAGASNPTDLVSRLPTPTSTGLQVEEGQVVSKVYIYL